MPKAFNGHLSGSQPLRRVAGPGLAIAPHPAGISDMLISLCMFRTTIFRHQLKASCQTSLHSGPWLGLLTVSKPATGISLATVSSFKRCISPLSPSLSLTLSLSLSPSLSPLFDLYRPVSVLITIDNYPTHVRSCKQSPSPTDPRSTAHFLQHS